MNVIQKRMREELYKSRTLRELTFSDNISYDKGLEIRKKQDESYKRWQFYKNLNKAMEVKK